MHDLWTHLATKAVWGLGGGPWPQRLHPLATCAVFCAALHPQARMRTDAGAGASPPLQQCEPCPLQQWLGQTVAQPTGHRADAGIAAVGEGGRLAEGTSASPPLRPLEATPSRQSLGAGTAATPVSQGLAAGGCEAAAVGSVAAGGCEAAAVGSVAVGGAPRPPGGTEMEERGQCARRPSGEACPATEGPAAADAKRGSDGNSTELLRQVMGVGETPPPSARV
jgi:hypothetical protein